jgi:hypothetical protein
MKTTFKLVAILLTACAWAHAQVVPEATGPARLPVSGNLHYSLRYSQTASFYGASQGNQLSSIASADVDYVHPNTRLPFKLDYGGGYMWALAGPSYGEGVFQHLLISQGLIGRKWNVTVSDNVSYTPQAPTTGFSGIPGTGEPIGGSGSNPPTSQSILTLNTRSVSNIASGEFGYNLNYATTLSLGANSVLLRYPDGNGLDTDGLQANTGLTRRLDARNSISGRYMFSHFSYGSSTFTDGSPGTFDTNSALFSYQRTWGRQLKTNVSVGPQWTDGSNSAIVPPSTNITVSAGVNWMLRSESASLNYNRGINGGVGYLPAGTVDSVNGDFSREFGRDLTIGLTGAYERTASLQTSGGVTEARYGGAQATRRLGRYLNVVASYSAIDQSSSLTSQTNVLNQLYQVISFGIAYSPRETHLRQ